MASGARCRHVTVSFPVLCSLVSGQWSVDEAAHYLHPCSERSERSYLCWAVYKETCIRPCLQLLKCVSAFNVVVNLSLFDPESKHIN